MLLCPVNYYYFTPYPPYVFYTASEALTFLAIFLGAPTIGYVLWRIFVTNRINPRGGICVLGLNETTATHAEMYGRRISCWTFALYVLTSLLTFKSGLLAFDFYYYVIETLLE